jgi:uncharacterized damage-inducible protein DinB
MTTSFMRATPAKNGGKWAGHEAAFKAFISKELSIVPALFAYDRWANTKVLDASRKLTAEQYVAEPVLGWSSVRSTINHIALATEFNLRPLAGDPDDRIPTEAELGTVDDAARLLERAHHRHPTQSRA